MAWIVLVLLSLWFWLVPPAWADRDLPASPGPAYASLSRASEDGIGKGYLGREIANVIGHRGAYWLERSSRALEERPDLLIKALELQPEMVVADIGAGTGYFTAPMARQVTAGRVYAVDVQPEMLALMERYKAESGLENVELVLGEEDDPKLPTATLDLALMVDAYHEFEYPYEMMQGIAAALKPGGLAVLAEYRGEARFSSIKPHHRMTQRQVKQEMAQVGLAWVKTDESLPEQHLMFFQKS
jgi:precorrin-6B methylase 2